MNQEKKNFRFETLQLHAGYKPDSATNARAVPIYASASFTFKNSEHAANVFAGKEMSYVYSRYLLRLKKFEFIVYRKKSKKLYLFIYLLILFLILWLFKKKNVKSNNR
jgi:hypothetical protein